jgi:hypothetical protein
VREELRDERVLVFGPDREQALKIDAGFAHGRILQGVLGSPASETSPFRVSVAISPDFRDLSAASNAQR